MINLICLFNELDREESTFRRNLNSYKFVSLNIREAKACRKFLQLCTCVGYDYLLENISGSFALHVIQDVYLFSAKLLGGVFNSQCTFMMFNLG